MSFYDEIGVALCPLCGMSSGKGWGPLLTIQMRVSVAMGEPHHLMMGEFCTKCSAVVFDLLKERALERVAPWVNQYTDFLARPFCRHGNSRPFGCNHSECNGR